MRSSLGLEHGLIRPVAASIRQLPEVDAAMSMSISMSSMSSSMSPTISSTSTSTSTSSSCSQLIDDLKRASDVFASFQKDGREHLAVQALLAECQQRLGLYDDAVRSIEELRNSLNATANTNANANANEDTVVLALAKVHWTRGDFGASQELCEGIISKYDEHHLTNESLHTTTTTTTTTKTNDHHHQHLQMASALSGKALSKLASMKSMDDAYSVRDFFRVAVKFLERQQQHPPVPPSSQNNNNTLPQAVALSNAGVAEIVYNLFLRDTNNVSVPMNPALKYLFRGLQKTNTNGNGNGSSNVAAATNSAIIEASIQANLAWGILNNYEDDDRPDRLTKASEYAKKALAFYDADSVIGTTTNNNNEGLSWVLSVVASCYHQAGGAVTAEGLFQSAISNNNHKSNSKNSNNGPPFADPLTRLQLRDAYLEYARLCTQWEKRETDAQNLRDEAEAVESSLPPAWRGKSSGIHGSLWFWTPGEFLE
eukprot:jgi/Psemu1/227639/e_gw1.2093.1.1